LKEGIELVRRYNLLMKDFPLDDLLSATDLPKIQDALTDVFAHLNNALRMVPYPIRRALLLVEAISRDFGEVMLRVLTSARLIYQPYDTFEKVH
jgi:dynein heavy chain 1